MAVAVQVVSDSRAAQQDMAKLQSSVDNISKSTKNATDTFKNLAISIGSISAATFGALGLARLSDSLTSINSKLLVVLNSQNAVNEAFKASRDIAISTRTSLADVSALYSRIAISSKELGASQRQITSVVSSVSKAISASGATAQEASAAVMQLGQALGSGRLQGDELRSILENAPLLAQQIAEGLGKSVSEMRELGAAGKLTSRDVFESILKQTSQIDGMAKGVGVTFSSAFTNVGNASKLMYDGLMKYLAEEQKISGKSLASRINDAAVSVAMLGSDFKQLVLDISVGIWRIALDAEKVFNKVGQQVRGIYSNVPDSVESAAKRASGIMKAELSDIKLLGFSFKLDTSKINIGQFFPNLETIKKLVLAWVSDVERAFFWLYDQVIGHSWIPDLVDGVIFWMKKLMGDPLGVALAFTRKVGDVFESLAARVASSDFVTTLTEQLSHFRAEVEKTGLAHNIRQALGMQEVQPGSFVDRSSSTGMSAYDLSSPVGRGPMRDQPSRTMFHDITNAFKSENQSPFLATIFTAVGAGLLMAVGSGSIIKGIAAAFAAGIGTAVLGSYNRMIPLGIFIGGGILAGLTGSGPAKIIAALVTTAFGLISARIISDRELSLTTGSIVNDFLSGVKGAINLLFGSGLFGEKGFAGTLALIAKLALMFAKGREIIGNAALAVAKAPTTIVDNLTDKVWLRSATKELAKNSAASALVTSKSQIATAQAQSAMAAAQQSINSATSNSSFMAAAAQMTRARQLLATSQALSAAAPNDLARLAEERVKLQAHQETLTNRIAEASKKFRDGVYSAGAGIGAIFGTMGGFHIGTQIAEQMKGYSDWSKVGVQMASAFVGQGVGAAIGTVVSATILTALTALPTVMGLATIGAIIWAAMHWDEVYASLQVIWSRLEGVFDAAWKQLAPVLDDAWKRLVLSLDAWADTLVSRLTKLMPVAAPHIRNVVEATKLDASGQINPFTLVATIAKELVGYRSDQKQGEIGGNSTETGTSFRVDPFIAGQVAAANSTVSPEDRSRNLTAWASVTKFFDRPISEVLTSITATLLGVKDAGAADTTRITGAIEASHSATRANIVVPPDNDTISRLVSAIRKTEGTAEGVTSFKGAAGAMQIIPDTFNSVVAQHKLTGKSFENAADRIEVATIHITDLWNKYQDPTKVFAAYNGGPKAVAATGELVSRHTMKDGVSIDNSTSYAARAMKVFEGGKSTGEKIGDAIAAKLDTAMQTFSKIKEDPRGAIEALLVKIGLKSPVIEGPPVQTKEEQLQSSLLSSKLEGLYSAEKSLEELNKAMAGINAGALALEQYKSIPKEELSVIVRNFDNIAKFNDALLGNLSDFTRRGTEERLADLATQNKKLLADATKKLADEGGLRLTASADASKAGTDYATKVRDDFSAALGAGLNGDTKGLRAFAKSFMENIGKTILNSFAKGVTDTFFKSSGLDNLLGNLIKSSMFTGEKGGTAGGDGVGGFIGTGVKKLFSLPAANKYDTKAGSQQTDILMKQDAAFAGDDPLVSALDSSTQQTVTAIDTASVKSSIDFSKMAAGFETGLTEMGGLMNSSFLNIKEMVNYGIDIPAGASVDWLRFAVGAVGKFMGAGGGTDATVATDNADYGGIASSAGVGSTSTYAGGSLSTSGSTALNYDISGANVSFRDSTVDFMRRAAGGYISGEGGPTADKIPALLSNGEFVINAKQTKRFGPLIEAINSGSIAHFATGGFVGADIGNTVVVKAAEKRNVEMGFVAGAQKSTSVFNINVTGDISRQTKSEIQRMIPQIAAGVGKHNYERR